jgi:pilus assembly protein FimV
MRLRIRRLPLGDALKKRSMNAGRFALSAVAAAALCVGASGSWALGLGRLAVQSALGEALRAEIDVTSMTPEEASSLRVRIAPPESYRAAGIDYNAVLPNTQAQLLRRADGRPYFSLTSDRSVQEPFVDVILEITWSSGRLVREYTMLFDPPSRSAPAMAASPVAPTISAAPAPTTAPSRPAPAPAPSVAAAPATRPAPAPAVPTTPPSASGVAESGDEYRVRRGDTLSRIASSTLRSGVSLDQMLVALYRGNPQAFIGDNMNRLRAGVVLTVPSAEAAGQVGSAEARQVIQAQSADFGAYRQRLAAGVPAVKADEPARQASGQVTAQVDDRKQAAVATPDKLKLSQGAAKASAAEAKLSKETEKKDSATRVAELSRNVEELKRLSANTAPPPVAPAPASAAAPAAPAPAPAPVASEPASTPAIVVPAAPPVMAAPSVPTLASAPSAAPPKKRTPAPAVPADEPGFLGSLLDNPMVLSAAGLLVLLLAGLGFYRLRNKVRKDSGETSFLESRLQPDSFFGASGGQRIDTRDASGVSSSMSYSLSQLDAIGDVDPVAEADVYLAYGRDLQAEEILKEAMRSNPERLAIRTKLLEVYAKRRDTKGYELLATQLFALTRGDGEDWAKAQELGLQIDPENPLYQPGGQPPAVVQGGDPLAEPLGASTMPQSVLPSASTFAPADAPRDSGPPSMSGMDLDLDLDLDLITPAEPRVPSAMEITQPFKPAADADNDGGLDFDLPALAPSPEFDATLPAAAPAASGMPTMDFNLDALDLDLPAAAPPPKPAPPSADFDFGNLEMPEPGAPGDEITDPLQRKLELAEEFRQIGDMEGARDLLEEVVAKAGGTLKSRAQGMLDALV